LNATSGGRLGAFLELGKLRLSSMAVVAVVAGLYLGADEISITLLVSCIAGTMLVAAGGNALNMYIEREHDRRMPRTERRPLPTGRLLPRQVLWFGVICVVVGLVILWLQTNAIATAICALIALTYVAIYTPLKRVTSLNTLVGAIPGGLPPLVGYTASHGALDTRAAVLFFILFFWQIPHFLSIAWRYREDYRRGGMKMLPVVDPGGATTSRQMVVYTLALLAASLFGYVVGLSGQLYFIVAVALGLMFLTPVLAAAIFRIESAMRMCFLASIIYLPSLLGVMVLDKN